MADVQPSTADNDEPANALAAATHRDPYPYYARRVAQAPLYRDPELGMWVATGATAVSTVLTHPACRVRPVSEPVPRALLGTAAGEIFGRLVRMNDGAGHCPLDRAVAETLAGVKAARLQEEGRRWARVLAEECSAAAVPAGATAFAFRLSTHVIASLLGLPATSLPRLTTLVHDFVRCLAPSPGLTGIEAADEVRQGIAAAEELLDLVQPLLSTGDSPNGLLAVLARDARRLERSGALADSTIVANGIGFLSQAYEATAGLIGNTLRALATQAGLRERLAADPRLLAGIVAEVARHDSPVQNTRRFVAADADIGGHAMTAGDTVLVVLAAANRDPALHARSARFDPCRAPGGCFTFGLGAHACPGERLASTLAEAGVAQLLASGLEVAEFSGAVTYRPSTNTRIPLWEGAAA